MLRYLVAAALLCACQAFAPAPTPRKRQLRKPAMLPDPTLSLALARTPGVATLFNAVTFVPQATCWIPMILSGCGVAKPVANAIMRRGAGRFCFTRRVAIVVISATQPSGVAPIAEFNEVFNPAGFPFSTRRRAASRA